MNENYTHSLKIKVNTILVLTLIETVPCSSFQLWIAVLTRPADSMWQLVTSRQCTSTHDLCSGSPDFSIRLQWGYAMYVGFLGGLASTKRSLTPVAGSEWKVEKRNWHALMRTYSLFLCLHHPEKWKLHESAACVWCLCCCVKQQCKTAYDFKVRVTMGEVGFNSCDILRQQCDSKFRSVQTMRLTRFCSPQPQCKLYFLNPAPLPHVYRKYGFWYNQRMPLHPTFPFAC